MPSDARIQHQIRRRQISNNPHPQVLTISGETDPAAIWAAVPAAPLIAVAAVAAVAGMLTLIAPGRLTRWLRLPGRHAITGAVVVVAAAVLGDLLMLALAARTGAAAAAGIATRAVAASTIRLACSVPVAARCLRSRRTLTGT